MPFVDNKTRTLAQLLVATSDRKINRLLVVGCGNGIEAAVIRDSLDCEVVGIDTSERFDSTAALHVDLRWGDATQMAFPDDCFDAIYSFHALEHIQDYRQALKEMRRVLRSGGVWAIGVPNRSRVLGYLGSKDATIQQKVFWNITDWRARLRAEFKNEFGAHAGFSAPELSQELDAIFTESFDITSDYYWRVYPNYQVLLKMIALIGLERWIYPAVYFVGQK